MIVAAPVLERFEGREGVVAGANRHAAYVDLDGFVVALTAPGVPLMPNGVALDGDPPAPGARVSFGFEEARAWDPALRLGGDPARRGAEILRALGSRAPPADLERAVEQRDHDLARRAAEGLIGRGRGLTPEGDDILAAAAAVVAAGPWPEGERRALLRALLPPDLRRRTTALSATLLELAAAGQVVEPLHALCGAGGRASLDRLLRLGHSTGRAYALGAAVAMVAMSRRAPECLVVHEHSRSAPLAGTDAPVHRVLHGDPGFRDRRGRDPLDRA
jgi:Protein of unknown function (DUF2877)